MVAHKHELPFLFLLQTSEPERRNTRRSTGSASKAQEDSSEPESHRHDEDDTDEEERVAEEQRPPPAMSSWSSDHNYIAVAPEMTTPISPSVLNKACMYLRGFPHFTDLSLCRLSRTDVRNQVKSCFRRVVELSLKLL